MGRRLATTLLFVWACGGVDDEPQYDCELVTDTATCAVNYAPTWADVYARTLAPGHSCGHVGFDGCHGSSNPVSGVHFSSSEHAYAFLLAPEPGWVRPGDPECSPLLDLFESGRMPPTTSGAQGLDEQDICAIAKWIEAGARAERQARATP